MGNLPFLLIFALLVIGYAIYTAYVGYESGAKTAPISASLAVAAALLTIGRRLWRESLIVYVGGLALCAVAVWHFDCIGQTGGPDNG